MSPTDRFLVTFTDTPKDCAMDDRRFDAFARSLALTCDRRSVVRGLIGLGLPTLAGIRVPHHTSAARRTTPTPVPQPCPGIQIFVDGRCICPDPTNTKCGPDCCAPGSSVCCDNACCFGNCLGEELCCPTGEVEFNGACCRPAGCPTEIPQSLTVCGAPVDDGCGGTIDCGCPAGWACTSDPSGSGSYCLNTTTTCIPGLSVCGSNALLAQCFGGGGYACSPDIDGVNTCATHELGFCGGTCTSDAECGDGYACAQACDQFCDNFGCLQLPPG